MLLLEGSIVEMWWGGGIEAEESGDKGRSHDGGASGLRVMVVPGRRSKGC